MPDHHRRLPRVGRPYGFIGLVASIGLETSPLAACTFLEFDRRLRLDFWDRKCSKTMARRLRSGCDQLVQYVRPTGQKPIGCARARGKWTEPIFECATLRLSPRRWSVTFLRARPRAAGDPPHLTCRGQRTRETGVVSAKNLELRECDVRLGIVGGKGLNLFK